MKSYVEHAVSILRGVLEDASIRWPGLRDSFEKDLSYLLRAVESRGLPFLTVTLPAVGKVLDQGLDNRYLEVYEFPKGFPLLQKRPKLFWGLFQQIFDESKWLRSDACIDSIAFLRQLLYCNKKLRIQCDDSKVKATLDEFFAIEQHLPPSWSDTWDSDVPVWKPRDGHPLWGDIYADPDQAQLDLGFTTPSIPPRDWSGLRQLCRYVVSSLGTPDWWDIQPKHGPGVVSEQSGFVSKYEFPYWPRKLDLWFPFDWHGSGSLEPGDVPANYEPPSRLIAVPKDQRGPRLICAEPLAHQWIQQGIWRWLEGRMRNTLLGSSITFRSQENSRNRALSASVDGKLATIDLSSASDRVSTRLVEYVFQGSEILEGLHASRTRVLGQNLSSEHPNRILLRKFSTMGSAVTFPIQSIVFCLLTVWAVRLHDGKGDTLDGLEDTFRSVTVFGDDIIAPAHALETIKLVLHECGLKVNHLKTFGSGCFRESCGVDAFKGYDVTPAYTLQPYDDSPSSMATTVEVANNFFFKGYWNTSDVLVSSIPPAERKLLRICGSDDGAFGLRSFVGTDTSHLRRGWDPDLQQSFSVSIAVTSKVTKLRGRGASDLTQYFTERPNPMFKWGAGQVGPVRLRKRRTGVVE
nr:MAG: hypothetical protein 3 [Leviviridae sp.]